MIDDDAQDRLRAEFIRRQLATSDVAAANAWRDALALLDMAATPQRYVVGAEQERATIVGDGLAVRPLGDVTPQTRGQSDFEDVARTRAIVERLKQGPAIASELADALGHASTLAAEKVVGRLIAQGRVEVRHRPKPRSRGFREFHLVAERSCPGCGSPMRHVRRLVSCGLPCDYSWHERAKP